MCVCKYTFIYSIVCVVHCRFWSEPNSLMLHCQNIIAYLDEMCMVHSRKGHVYVWDGRSSHLKVEGVQVSVCASHA